MKKNDIYGDCKIKRNFSKYGSKRLNDFRQNRLADDINARNNQDSIKYNYNQELFVKGREWSESNLSLDDAPEEMRNNVSFIAGFEKGERLKFINQQLFDLGKEYFESNKPFDSIPDNYRNNEFFMAGYNDSKKKIK